MKIFTSDLHHEHRRIVEFTNRGKDTTQQQHTDWLVDIWNTNATKSDLIYVLGDYSFSMQYKQIADFTDRLNGQKIIIKGNHDKREHLDQLVKDGFLAAWYDYKEIKLGDTPVVLFHYPIASWHRQGYGACHLHGHCHGNFKDYRGKMLDVGIDSVYNLYGKHGFLDEHQIVEFMKEEKLYIADHHKEYK